MRRLARFPTKLVRVKSIKGYVHSCRSNLVLLAICGFLLTYLLQLVAVKFLSSFGYCLKKDALCILRVLPFSGVWISLAATTGAVTILLYIFTIVYSKADRIRMPKYIDLSFIAIYTLGSLTEPEPRRFFPKGSTGKVYFIILSVSY